MKKISLLIILAFLFSLGTGVLAQTTELPDPGLAPDSPFYFLETIAEGIGSFFTFGDLKKAERYAALAAERIAEAKAVAEKGKPELAEKALKRYENQLNKSIVRAEKAMNKGKDFDKVMESIANAGKTTSLHLEVLTELHERASEQTKTVVENAMKVSVKRHEKAVEALKASNNLGEVPEEVPFPAKVSAEVRDRIQRKAQTESMIEEALQSSESPRDICMKGGAPQEMCEKIPVQGFKSFEAIKTFCTDAGGPSEVCASLESMCKEVGVTTPDECIRVLMISSVQAYHSVELKSQPAPSLPEE